MELIQKRSLLLAAICSCLWRLTSADGTSSCEDVCRAQCAIQGVPGSGTLGNVGPRTSVDVFAGSSQVVGGDNQVFTGDHIGVRGNDNYVRGNWVQVSGNGNKIFGSNAQVNGHQSKIVGDNATVVGDFAIVRGRSRALVVGSRATVFSDNAQVLGAEARVTGERAHVIGNGAVVVGNFANISGNNVKVIGGDAFVCCDIGNGLTVNGSFLKIGVVYKKTVSFRSFDLEAELSKFDNHVLVNGVSSMVTSVGCRGVKDTNNQYTYELTMSGQGMRVFVDEELMQGTTLDKNGNKITIVT